MNSLINNILDNSIKNYQAIGIVTQKKSQLKRIQTFLEEWYGENLQKCGKLNFLLLDGNGTSLHLRSLDQKHIEGSTLHTIIACDFETDSNGVYQIQFAPMLARTGGKTIAIETYSKPLTYVNNLILSNLELILGEDYGLVYGSTGGIRLETEEEHKLRKRREIGESRNELINKQVLRLLKCEVASTYVLLLELSELEYFEEILRIYHKFVKAINKKDGQIHLNTSDGSYIGR